MGLFDYIVDKLLLPEAESRPYERVYASKPKIQISKHETLTKAAKKFFTSPREAADLYSFAVIAHYALRQPNALTYTELEAILIKTAYG